VTRLVLHGPIARRALRSSGGAVRFLALAWTLLPCSSSGQAPRELTAEAFVGTAWSLRTPLTLDGSTEQVRISARYSTRPLRDSPYYSVRLAHTWEGRGAELEFIHHKVYLENPAPPIEHLEVTHGYNLLMANGVAPAAGWQFRVGLGLVIAHPDGRVGGQTIRARSRTLLGGGYHVSGGALQVALGRRYALTGGRLALTAAPEVKVTGSFASMRLAQGTLRVPNVAVHALAGLGVRRRTR
jgi:hypothetical protein